jgi:hypothetical protein
VLAGFEVPVDGFPDDIADLAMLVFGEPTDTLIGVVVEPDTQTGGVP